MLALTFQLALVHLVLSRAVRRTLCVECLRPTRYFFKLLHCRLCMECEPQVWGSLMDAWSVRRQVAGGQALVPVPTHQAAASLGLSCNYAVRHLSVQPSAALATLLPTQLIAALPYKLWHLWLKCHKLHYSIRS